MITRTFPRVDKCNQNQKPPRVGIDGFEIPPELPEIGRWVCWRWDWRNNKWTKPPIQIDGSFAKNNEPATWTTFSQAMDAFRKNRSLAGIGFVFTDDDDIVGVDIDNCILPDGSLDERGKQAMEHFGDSYGEVSPSGTGLKFLIRGQVPGGKSGRKNPKLDVELYGSVRYFTLTGRRVTSGREVVECQDKLDSWCRAVFDEPQLAKSLPVVAQLAAMPLSVQDIVDKAAQATNGGKFQRLWNGDTSDHAGDDSAADMALCSMLAFWCAGDANLIDQCFRQSGLFRDKWERDDYRSQTIEKAIAGCREFYSNVRPTALAERATNKLTDLKLTLASEIQEQSLEWLWQNRFLVGHVNIIAGDPGLGKSLTAVDAAARVSTGTAWPDGSPCKQGKVIYGTTEDGYADTVKPRLSAAGADVSQIVFLEGMEYSDGSEGPLFLDEHVGYLDLHLSAVGNVRLLILDTLQSFVGDRTNTNNNASSRRVMTPLKRLAEKHRVAILCIEHLTKSTTTRADNATYRIQGSIAFTGAARSVWIVCKDKADPKRRILQASKTNLAPDTEGLGLAFTVIGPVGRPVIEWAECNIRTPISELLSADESGPSDHSATELERACQFLSRVVTEPVSAKEIAAGCKAEMISEATLRRAKEQLGIQSSKDGKNWLWLPSEQMQQDRINGIASLFPD